MTGYVGNIYVGNIKEIWARENELRHFHQLTGMDGLEFEKTLDEATGLQDWTGMPGGAMFNYLLAQLKNREEKLAEVKRWAASFVVEKHEAQAANAALRTALEPAQSHCEELREAWERGALDEHDGQGGTRSNRNVKVLLALRAALSPDAGTGWLPPEVREQAQALCEKLDEIMAHPSYQSVFTQAHNHGFPYSGPTWEKELNVLRAALDALEVKP